MADRARSRTATWSASRPPGRPATTVYQDPITATTGFYRSLAVQTLGVTTDEVVSGGYGDTSVNPTSLVVPGNAAVTTDGAGVYGDLDSTGVPTTTLPAGTRLHVVEQPTQPSDAGGTLVEVAGIDDPSIAGYMLASDLAARDSTAPVVRVLDPGAAFSPNGDGQRDAASLRGRFTESVAWTLKIRDGADHELFSTTGTGSTFQVAWDGKVSGDPVADGTYQVSVSGVDPWGNGPARATRELTVDTAAPELAGLTPAASTTQWFSPNGDGVRDTVSLTATNREPGSIVTRVVDAGGAQVRSWTVANGSAAVAVTWNGRTTARWVRAGRHLPDPRRGDGHGRQHRSRRRADRQPGRGAAHGDDEPLALLPAGPRHAGSRDGPVVHPRTPDDRHLDAAQRRQPDRHDPPGRGRAAGRHPDLDLQRPPIGRQDAAAGHYTSYVSATDGTLSAVQGAAFDMDAFVIKLNDSTPKRGQSITITATTAELLSKSPSLSIYQPRLARWSVRMSKVVRPHVPDHDPAQVQRWHRQGHVPGQGHRHQGRIAVHVRVVRAALTRLIVRGRHLSGSAAPDGPDGPRRHLTAPDRPPREPHQTPPDHPVPSRTGTIEP